MLSSKDEIGFFTVLAGGYESDFFVRSVLSLALCKFSHIRKQNEGLFINIKWEASDDDRKND